jgi:putative membrane protein|tara:strand:+ start:446 stop:988 length:543 start_codon:yes stop_codon:yes gene_type:complete
MEKENIIDKPSFNPKIKTYFFVLGCFIGLIPFFGWLFILVWIFGFGKYWTKKQYNALECQLNENTLYFKKGVMVTLEKTIPLENIQDLAFKEGPLLRYFGLAILQIETAGGQGAGPGGDLTLIGLNGAKEFKEKVLAQRQAIKSQAHSGAPSVASSNNNTDVLLEISETLKRIENKLPKA